MRSSKQLLALRYGLQSRGKAGKRHCRGVGMVRQPCQYGPPHAEPSAVRSLLESGRPVLVLIFLYEKAPVIICGMRYGLSGTKTNLILSSFKSPGPSSLVITGAT